MKREKRNGRKKGNKSKPPKIKKRRWGKTCWHKETNHLQPSQFFFSPFTHCRRRRRLLDMKHLGRSASAHIHTQHVHFPSRIPHASRDLPHTFLCDSIQPCFFLLLLLDCVCIRHVFPKAITVPLPPFHPPVFFLLSFIHWCWHDNANAILLQLEDLETVSCWGGIYVWIGSFFHVLLSRRF